MIRIIHNVDMSLLKGPSKKRVLVHNINRDFYQVYLNEKTITSLRIQDVIHAALFKMITFL